MTFLMLMAKRIALLAVTLWLVSLLTFSIVEVLPGDAAQAMLGDAGTPAQVEALRRQIGLDRPWWVRYGQWMEHALQGDLGLSQQYRMPVAEMIGGRLRNSAVLGALALLISAPLAIGLGTLAAVHEGRWLDRVIGALTLVGFGLPEYVLGALAILLFSIWFPLLPASSLVDPGQSPWARPAALVLPVLVLTLGLLTYVTQITRSCMSQALRSDYVRTALLKGMPYRRVVLRHALPNVMLPVLAEIGMHFGYVIGGLVVVETLFSYAGIGQMMMSAVSFRDIVAVQGTVLVIALAYGCGNLIADLFAIGFDPRLRTRAA